jgi:uncharacterized delta-60 repeat protein
MNGSLDSGFNPNADSEVYCIAVQSDSKILVGGYFTTMDGQPRNRIARLNLDGSVDSGFNPGASAYFQSIVLQPDGKILVGGAFSNIGGGSQRSIARLNPDGSLETAFNPSPNFNVNSVALQADGKILLGGDFSYVGGQTRNKIARLNADGTLDTTFNPDANGNVRSVALQVDARFSSRGNSPTWAVSLEVALPGCSTTRRLHSQRHRESDRLVAKRHDTRVGTSHFRPLEWQCLGQPSSSSPCLRRLAGDRTCASGGAGSCPGSHKWRAI